MVKIKSAGPFFSFFFFKYNQVSFTFKLLNSVTHSAEMIHSEREKKVGSLKCFFFLYHCVFGFDWGGGEGSACEYISRLPISGM